MKILNLKRLYLPAFTIVAIVLVLLIFISISTYRNMDRYENRVLEFVNQNGLAFLELFESGVRAGKIKILDGDGALNDWLRDAGNIKEIEYLYIYDFNGRIVSYTQSDFKHKQSDPKTKLYFGDNIKTGFYKRADGAGIWEIVKQFALNKENFNLQYLKANNIIPPFTVVLGMATDSYEKARKADLHHSIVMAAIVIALGSGVIFFIFVIQNYHIVNRTLKQTKDYTHLVLENMANGLLSIDMDGNLITCNSLALELLEIDENDIKTNRLKDIIDFQNSGIQEMLETQKPIFDHEFVHTCNSGECLTLSASITPIPAIKDTRSGAVIVLRDLTEIKRLESKIKRSEKLAAIGALSAGVAHEIRNPLSSIKGFAQFLHKSLEDKPKEKEYARVMVIEVDRINQVVNDLLTFARPPALRLETTNVPALINHAVLLVEDDAKSKGIIINKEINVDFETPQLDANQMTQALLNLLLNSLQSGTSGNSISIGSKCDYKNSMLWLWVEDDGPGIPGNIKDSIFDPFFTKKKGGTGLGLSIVNKIVNDHSGEINIESPVKDKNIGCRFTIVIPLILSESEKEKI